ncbi:MAG: zinc-finger domain-containing protein [Alphaproteobacteria bacterium]
MEPSEVIETETTVVRCDGGGGALGHPQVYLNMGDKREIDCPYCGRLFTLKAGASAHAH